MSYAYDPAGRETLKWLANGVRMTHAYDAAGRTTGVGTGSASGLIRRLAKLLDRKDFAVKAEETLRGYYETMAEHPAAAGQMLIALDFYLGPVQEIAVIGKASDPETQRALDAIRRAFRPNSVLAFHDPATGKPPEFIPLLKDKPAVDDKVTVYVCENFACQAPLVGVEAVEKALGERPR